jgi:hypothetical protein
MTVPPESALWMEGVDSKDGSKDGAISLREPSPLASEAAIFVASSSYGRVSTIAGALRDWHGLLIVALFVGLAVFL